jgi:hypothetical protein
VPAASGHGVAPPRVAAESRRAVLQDIATCRPCHSTSSSSSPTTASPVPAFSNHPLAWPARPQAPPESLEPRRPLQRQPRPLLWPAAGDSPPPERRCRGEPLTVSFPSLHHPKSDPRAGGVHLGHFPHPSHRRSPESAGAAVARAPWPPLPCFQIGLACFGP